MYNNYNHLVVTLWFVRVKFLGSFTSVSVNIFQIMFALTFALCSLLSHYAFCSDSIHPGHGETFLRGLDFLLLPFSPERTAVSSFKGQGRDCSDMEKKENIIHLQNY